MFFENAYAFDASNSILWQQIDFGEFILLAISLFVLISGVLSIIFILWWGLLLILSGGKDEKIKPAINTIRYAIIWIVVTVLTIFLFPIFWNLLWIDVDKYAQPKRIFQKIEEIGNKIFGSSSSSGIPTTSSDLKSIDKLPTNFTDGL